MSITDSPLHEINDSDIVIHLERDNIKETSLKRKRIKKTDDDLIQLSYNEFNESNQDDSISLRKCDDTDYNREFDDNSSYQKHLLTLLDKTFNCPYSKCGKKFLDNSKLRRHSLVHSGVKPYKCEFCHKCFSLDFNLRTHMRIHTGEKPYVCSYPGCFKRFSQSSNLSAHEKSYHIEKEIENYIAPINNINKPQNIIFKSLDDVEVELHSPVKEIKKIEKKLENKYYYFDNRNDYEIITDDYKRKEIFRKNSFNDKSRNEFIMTGVIIKAYPSFEQ